MPENQNLNNEQQETTSSGNKIYILSRNNYDNWQGSYGSNIFFVRENSADQDKMVSVYVGESKQSNIVVADESDIWDRTTNDYTIPEKYQVSDKLFLIKRTLATGTEQETPDNTIYGIVTWNGERFIDCGVPNNVIVLTDVEEGISDLGQWLSQNITGIKDFIYIVPNYHSIYYYDGADGYISIISVDSFVTVEMLNEVASRIPVADELTVLSKVSNSQTVFSAAGADLSDKWVITGFSGSETSEQAGPGATIFNNYNPTPVSGKQGYKYGTSAIGAYSSAFGTGNVTRSANSVAFGSSNTIGINGANSSVFGSSNTVSGSNSSAFGSYHTVSGTNSVAFGGSHTVGGYSNVAFGVGGNTIDSSAAGTVVFGTGNNSYSSMNFISGTGNTSRTPKSVVIGSGNILESSHKDSSNNFIIGKSNVLHATTAFTYSNYARNIHVFGDTNHIGSAQMANGLQGSTYIIGQGNTVGPNGLSGDNTYIIGWDNQVGDSGQNYSGNAILIGTGLKTGAFNHGLYIGKNNTGVTEYDLVIGDGSDATVDRFDMIGIRYKTVYVNPDHIRATSNYQGDMMSGFGTSLTLRSEDKSPTATQITGEGIWESSYLPLNNSITKIQWGNANKLKFMLNSTNKFIFPTFANNIASGVLTLDQTTDYSCLLVIPKLNSFNSAPDIIVNFTANDTSKIYLLNPDIDISSYTTLHVLLFYDLTNLCAIVSGYQEVTTP